MVETFGNRLKELRLERGISQIELAKAIGVGKSIISLWERDESEASYSKVDMLAAFFGVSCDYLIRGDK